MLDPVLTGPFTLRGLCGGVSLHPNRLLLLYSETSSGSLCTLRSRSDNKSSSSADDYKLQNNFSGQGLNTGTKTMVICDLKIWGNGLSCLYVCCQHWVKNSHNLVDGLHLTRCRQRFPLWTIQGRSKLRGKTNELWPMTAGSVRRGWQK